LKKRSAASYNSKQPKSFVFFLDRSLGKKKIAGALRRAGAEVEVHDDHFPPGAKDQDWLPEVGRRGWILFTKDRRIRYRVAEVIALMRAGVRAFVLTAGDLQAEEMAAVFIKALPRVIRFTIGNPAPFIAKITRGGAVTMLASGAKRRRFRK
jgi:hypothetical protein